MPFVDINSIGPKKQVNGNDPQQVTSPNTDNALNNLGVREIKGPPLKNEPVNVMQEIASTSTEDLSKVVVESQELPKIEVQDPEPVTNVGMPAAEENMDFEFAIGTNKKPPMPQPTPAPEIEPQQPVASTPVIKQEAPKVVLDDTPIQKPVFNRAEQIIQENEPLFVNNSEAPKAEVINGLDASKLTKRPKEVILNNENNLPIMKQQVPPINESVNLATKKEQVNNNQKKNKPELSTEKLQTKEYGLDEYLKVGVEKNASDLHFSAGYRVYARINGSMDVLPSKELTEQDTLNFATQMFDRKGLSKEARKNIKDLDLAYDLETGHRFRVNVYKQKGSYGLVFRLIPNEIKSTTDLNLPSVMLDFAKLPYGLVLVTGPTGSGKSTTLAALINYINQTARKHIITIEDPIEFLYPVEKSKVDQREISQDTDGWDIALRSALRQDPDVVLVGEMRDFETISSAIRIAETGHLVFATLHTNSAAQTIDRIIDVFPDNQQSQVRIQLANTLQAVIAQRLVPNSTGDGRIPSLEILVATDAVRASIRENKIHQINNIIQTSADVGMITMEQSLVNLVRKGLITTEIAQEYTSRPEEILALLSRT